MTVYFIQAGSHGPIKIGFTEGKVISRKRDLQVGSFYKLHIIGVIDGAGLDVELALHRKFAADRIRGEWFHCSSALLGEIEDVCDPPKESDETPPCEFIAWLKSERGRAKELASELGISPPAISQWEAVPAERVIAVEGVTGISRHVLRPDVFGQVAA